MVKILTFYSPKEKDYEKVVGESMTDQDEYESLPDLIARVIRGEVKSQSTLGYTVGMDDDSDEAFEACEDVNDVDIVPTVILDESGFNSGIAVQKDNNVPPQASVAPVEAPSDSAAVSKEQATADGETPSA